MRALSTQGLSPAETPSPRPSPASGGGSARWPQSALAFPAGWAIRPSDPNEIRSFLADGSIATGEIVQIRPWLADRAGRRRLPARGPARRAGAGPGQAAPSGAPGDAAGRAASRPAGRAGFLGPAAAAGAARPVASDGDPLPDRN